MSNFLVFLDLSANRKRLNFAGGLLGVAMLVGCAPVPVSPTAATPVPSPSTEPAAVATAANELPPRWARARAEAPPTPPATAKDLADEAQLAQRVAARWKAILAKDHAVAYEFLSPASRLNLSREKYADVVSSLDYLSANLAEAQCRNGLCWAQVTVTKYVNLPGVVRKPLPISLRERWMVADTSIWLLSE
jgi:hypothetical protein